MDLPVVTSETPYTLCYTSGTTGDPKGAIITHGGMLSCIAALKYSDFKWAPTDRHISYLPLAHIYERAIYNCCAFEGGSVGIFGGDVKKLTLDMAALKPTVFVSVPRLYNKYFAAMKAKMPNPPKGAF